MVGCVSLFHICKFDYVDVKTHVKRKPFKINFSSAVILQAFDAKCALYPLHFLKIT